jgi:hypothetical protein
MKCKLIGMIFARCVVSIRYFLCCRPALTGEDSYLHSCTLYAVRTKDNARDARKKFA